MKKKIASIILTAVILCSGSPAFSAVNVRVGNMVSIASGTVNMRSGPGKKYAVKWEMDKGYPLRVVGSKGNWLKVKDFENDEGWIYKKLVSRKPHLIVKVNKGSNKKFKLYEKPAAHSSTLGEAGPGTVFKVRQWSGEWVKVSHKSGLQGWVKRSLLINIRSGPGIKYKVIGQAAYGSLFKTLKRGNGWVKVRHQGGLSGWMKRSLLWGW